MRPPSNPSGAAPHCPRLAPRALHLTEDGKLAVAGRVLLGDSP